MVLRAAILAATAALFLAPMASPLRAADGAALIAPMSGTFEALGRDMRRSAIDVLGEALPVIDDGCDPEQASAGARDVVLAGDRLVIGLPCIDAFDAAMPMLANADIPVLAVGLRAADITAPPRNHEGPWPVFRIAPRAGAEVELLADFISSNWRDASLAVIDDGTLYGRQLSETVRLILSDEALEPIVVDTYRPLLENQTPLVRRLQRAGATHVIIGGEARDAAVIAQNAARIGYDLTLAGGSILIAPPDDGRLPEGTIIAAVPPQTDLTRIAAQIAQQTLSADFLPVEALRLLTFATDLGPVGFGPDGEPDIGFVRLLTIQDGRPRALPDDADG